ncbi:MAG: hypothetical protein DMG21_07260, partial [Acidobacteria bacterium]
MDLIGGTELAHNFLTVTHPVGEGVLVVEAWISAPAMAEAATVFSSGHYRYLVLVGGPVQEGRSSSTHPGTYTDRAAEGLVKLGFDDKKLIRVSVPAEPTGLRTLASADAVKLWLDRLAPPVCCLDVFTVGVHARKSWVLFGHELGNRYRVGIIAGAEGPYDQSNFWFFSTRGIWIFVR